MITSARRAAAVVAAALALPACGPSRIEIEPSTVHLHGRGQRAQLHASPRSSRGDALASEVCRWTSTNEAVAKVDGPHNEATVSAAGHGRATVRCSIGKVSAEVPVVVTLATRLDVNPKELDLRMLDEPVPLILSVQAFDAEGREIRGRVVATRCENEDVCRGDARGQVWAAGPGTSRVFVQVDDAQAEVVARVIDARSAAAKPQPVSGNPMEHIGDPAPGGAPGRKR